MDEADRASQLADDELSLRLNEHREAASRYSLPKGHCLYCGEPLDASLSFCDADCMGDWQYLRHCDERNGRQPRVSYYDLPEGHKHGNR